MKKKIISLILVLTIFTSFCVKPSYAHEEINHIAPKSAIAISGATATAILTLATYAGMQFHDSESFDEFLRRMCGMEQSIDFLVSVTALVGKSVNGVVEFTQDMIDDFTFMLNQISINKNLKYRADVNGNYLPVLNSLGIESKERIAFLRIHADNGIRSTTTSPSPVKTISYGDSYLTVQSKAEGYRAICNSDDLSAETVDPCFWSTGYNSVNPSLGNITVIGVYESTTWGVTSTYFAHVSCAVSDDFSTWSYPNFYYCRDHKINSETLYEKQLNSTIGSAWQSGKGEIESNTESGEGVAVQIPSSMDTLLDKSPSDVSTPTYEIWNPGKDVAIPEIANPGITYTPDTSTDNPGDTDTDNPGDTDTDNPGDTDTGTQNPGIPDFGPITVPDIDFTPLQLSISSITEKFPFSLPWDIKRIAETFKGNSNINAPVINFEFNDQNMVLDFNRFNAIAMIIRGFVFVEFAIGLIYVTRKLKP